MSQEEIIKRLKI